MQNTNDNVCFFTGTNSENGFFSVFDKIYSIQEKWNAFLIKGGPGSGKSTFMKGIGKIFKNDYDYAVQYIYCSSDPDSLDGIILPQQKICILDATSPHALEPKYPGACEHIINISDCWDEKMLINARVDISALANECSKHHKTAQIYIKAASGIEQNICGRVNDYLDSDKLKKYVLGLCRKEIGTPTGKAGEEQLRLLSAVTPKGMIQYNRTVELLCDRIICINDEYGAVLNGMMKDIRSFALENGHSIITCFMPLHPQSIEHIILPDLRLAFVSNTGSKKCVIRHDKNIYAKRFYNMDMVRLSKQKITFSKRVVNDLLEQAYGEMRQAKAVHDNLERYYINAMDFDKADRLFKSTVDKIKGIIDVA